MSQSNIQRIAPQSGHGFTLKKHQILRVIDPEGEQVADFFAFAAGDSGCWLSSGRTIDYASRIFLTTGDILYSNDSRPMATVVADTARRHDFLLTPCSQEMFEILYQHKGHHASCFENLCTSLAPYGIHSYQIGTTFNIFMTVDVANDGIVTVGIPSSKPGDHIDLRAEMDLIVGLTACSAENSNNRRFKPIHYEILD